MDDTTIINIRRLVDLSSLSLWRSITLILTAKTIPSQDYKNCLKPELEQWNEGAFHKELGERMCKAPPGSVGVFGNCLFCGVSKMYFKSTRFLLCLDYLSDSNEENAVGFLWWRFVGFCFVF